MERVEKSIQTLSCGWNPWSCSSKGSMLNAHYHPSGPFQEQVLCLSIRFLQADLFEIFTALSDFQFPYVQDSSTALFT
jgi:hypothetical protein